MSVANADAPAMALALYEGEAHAALRRAEGHATALTAALEQARNGLVMASSPVEHDASRVLDLLALTTSRLRALTRRLGDGDGARR